MRLAISSFVLALGLAGLPAAAFGQDRLQEQWQPHITVVGEGTTNVAPDLAIIQAGVTTQGKTARAASEANSTTMGKVLSTLKAAGISDRDIQTSYFSIRPVYDSRRDGDNRITGFQASNQIGVKVRALPKLPTLLDQMIAAGANDISGINFTVAERSRLLDDARTEAVDDARRRAELLAKAAGVRLGRAIVIVENGGRPPIPMEKRMTMRAAPAASVPVAVGEQTIRVHVDVTYELLR